MTSSMRLFQSRRSGISSFLGALYLTACTSWHVGTPTPAQFIEREHPAQVRVTRADGSTVLLDSPVVRGDSLVGQLAGTPTVADSARGAGLPLGDVASVAIREPSAGKTILLTAGIVVGVFGILTIASFVAWGQCEDFDC